MEADAIVGDLEDGSVDGGRSSSATCWARAWRVALLSASRARWRTSVPASGVSPGSAI